MKNIARLAVMSWIKVVTHPLGIAGFALALVFGVVSRVMAQKRNKNTQWIVPAAYALWVGWLSPIGTSLKHRWQRRLLNRRRP
jgi:hypothetical protein